MKKIFFVAALFFCVPAIFAQTDKQNIRVSTNSEPVYPKGDQALYTYVYQNLNYSEESKKKYVEGEVTLSFDVKADSTIANVSLISGVGHGVDEEVKRLIQTLKFAPGTQNGVAIKMNTMYTFPVKAH